MTERKPFTVMLVDSQSGTYEELAVPMARRGAALFQAMNPADALLLARELRPDCVLINLAMPRRIGDFVFSLLRDEDATASIPVVFLVDGLRWGRRAQDHAADAIVPQPWQAEDVLDAIWRAVPVARDWPVTDAVSPLGGPHATAR